MVSKAILTERICGDKVESEVEVSTTAGKCRIKLNSSCPKISLFAKKLEELEFDRTQVYDLKLYDLWLIAKSCGLKPYCPVPTVIINAIWLENGMVAESLANRSVTRMLLKPSDRDNTKIKIEQPLCGYVAFVKANSVSPRSVNISISTPCSKIREHLKEEIESKPFRGFEDCERVFKQVGKITAASCFIPVAVAIAYALETQAIKIEETEEPILEVSLLKS